MSRLDHFVYRLARQKLGVLVNNSSGVGIPHPIFYSSYFQMIFSEKCKNVPTKIQRSDPNQKC